MKTYIVESDTNYDLMVHIVNAENEKEAIDMARAAGAWEGCKIHELDVLTRGVVHHA